MNKINYFAGLVVLASLSSASAGEMHFVLNCAVESDVAKNVPSTVLAYEVIKTVRPNTSGAPGPKWTEEFTLGVRFKDNPSALQTLPLVPAGSGDEDYSDYQVSAPDSAIAAVGVQGASIQNRFEWVSLIDVGGSAFATCRK